MVSRVQVMFCFLVWVLVRQVYSRRENSLGCIVMICALLHMSYLS